MTVLTESGGLELSACSEIAEKIRNQTLQEQDFDAVFQLFAQICNSEDMIVFNLRGYSESFQFIFEEYSYGMIFKEGRCEVCTGRIKWPGLTFRISKKTVLEILTGQVYSAVAHMAGQIDYTGFKSGAIKFMEILEDVLDEILNEW